MKNLITMLLLGMLFLASCQKQTDKKQLESEIEQLRPIAEKQSLKKELEEIKNCTVDGSVFIVTRGGQNYKLGLVPIIITETEKMNEHLESTFVDLESDFRKRTGIYNSMQSSLAQSLNDLKPILENYQTANEQFSAAVEALKHYADVYESLHKASIKNEADLLQYQQAAAQFLKAKSNLENAASILKPKYDSLDWSAPQKLSHEL